MVAVGLYYLNIFANTALLNKTVYGHEDFSLYQ
ncbi:hypothetical protein SAMN05444266_103551 [Chitinophaga jiangningensis]|uniref:Uncharacterized protein n=1 Tax=Chitinophaga jiangningensis TaxID=1419482 RepID=A0A1M7B751_9BACT|nr:hypothetical protein SAMN05444266_103551 [Chitinophaga jiangningensis]